MYVFQIFDYYSCSGIVLLWILFFESIAVGWIFGEYNFFSLNTADIIMNMLLLVLQPNNITCFSFENRKLVLIVFDHCFSFVFQKV